jgi:hypothetical protein
MSIRTVLIIGTFWIAANTPILAQESSNGPLDLPKSDRQATTSSQQGRYQIIISPHAARDTFLLDTETGRVWQMTIFGFLNDEPVVWNAMPRIDNHDDYTKIVNEHGRKSRQPLSAR